MGYGDDVMATGLARGAQARGKRIAFGAGKQITWGPWSAEVFRNNPNIAPPGAEHDADIEWIHYCKGHRQYNTFDSANQKWIWHYENWKAIPGEMFFDYKEQDFADSIKPGFILFEPTLPMWKGMSVNKDWGFARFQEVADRLIADGQRVAQFRHKKSEKDCFLKGVEFIDSPDYRSGLAALQRAKLYVGVEGGLHHGAAAVNVPGVVIFGGFVSPQSTGYDIHTNLFIGGEACGKVTPCDHCRKALDAISVDDVYGAAKGQLNG